MREKFHMKLFQSDATQKSLWPASCMKNQNNMDKLQTNIDQELQAKIEKALDSIRPFLRADGGDVELVDVLKNGIVQVRLIGACQTCSMAEVTLRTRVERAVRKQVPGIKAVESV